MRIRRYNLIGGGALMTALAWGAPALAFGDVTSGGKEGEIDIDASFSGSSGESQPTEVPSTFQTADIKVLGLGAGYTVGTLGPLERFYLRIEGGFYNAAAETQERVDPSAELGTVFYPRDRGGFVMPVMAANFLDEKGHWFGAFLRGTIPIGVDFAKFSSIRLDYVAAGLTGGAYLTNPDKLVRLSYEGVLQVGSGMYTEEGQMNASVSMRHMFVIEARRWILPWRVGLRVGPTARGDLVEHENPTYRQTFGELASRSRTMIFGADVRPYFQVTKYMVVEFGYRPTLFGNDLPATQVFSAGVRAAF